MTRPAPFVLAATLLALVACAGGPDLPPLPASTAPAPRLLPLDALLAGIDAPVATDALAQDLAGRAARLRARAGLMRGPVMDPVTRARLAAAIARGDA